MSIFVFLITLFLQLLLERSAEIVLIKKLQFVLEIRLIKNRSREGLEMSNIQKQLGIKKS